MNFRCLGYFDINLFKIKVFGTFLFVRQFCVCCLDSSLGPHHRLGWLSTNSSRIFQI